MKNQTVIALMVYALCVGFSIGYFFHSRRHRCETSSFDGQHEFNLGVCSAYERIAGADGVYLGPLELKNNSVVSNCVFITLPVACLNFNGSTNSTVAHSQFYSY